MQKYSCSLRNENRSRNMFVSSLVNDWFRKLDRRGCRSEELQDLEVRQRAVWTPPEIFEKCCSGWLQSGKKDRTFHDREKKCFACTGGCNKFHPAITLFFDSERSLTVAIISHRLDPFVLYLEERVFEGTARRKTMLCYELDGFIRENLSRLKNQERFGYHLVEVAVGALNESDAAHRKVLERDLIQRRPAAPFERIEECMEICRLHRLGEDLDVLSIYMLGRTCKSLKRVANAMVKTRMEGTRLLVSPLADGCILAGYSVFRRRENMCTIVQKEHGRFMEYSACDTIECASQAPGRFAPAIGSISDFEWNCEELSFQNLERGWGDVGVREYLGQKLVVSWLCGAVDIAHNSEKANGESISLASYRLSSSQKRGTKKFEKRFFTFEVFVSRSGCNEIDDVTVSFSGRCSVVQIKIDFLCLLRAYARTFEPCLKAQYAKIQENRPLLEHEKAYLKEVIDASSLGS